MLTSLIRRVRGYVAEVQRQVNLYKLLRRQHQAIDMSFTDMLVSRQIVHVRVDVSHVYRNIIGPCVQLKLCGPREAEIGGSPVEIRWHGLVNV